MSRARTAVAIFALLFLCVFVYKALLYKEELAIVVWPFLMFVYGLQICYVYVFKKIISAARIVLEAEENEFTRSLLLAIACAAVVLSAIRV
jgi:hypothetical protein